jgi:predicted thioesterase
VLAVVFGNHLQAGGAAVHGVELVGEGEHRKLIMDYKLSTNQHHCSSVTNFDLKKRSIS